jgi:FMN phosphatase YigB (HAD superfamily)
MHSDAGARASVVFLLDVDNTLLDNDGVTADLKRFLTAEVGEKRQERYWVFFEELRSELGYADYLGALQRYRVEYPRDPHLFALSSFLIEYPFADRLYPDALEVVRHLSCWGPTVILTDGDVVFQPHKIRRSGLFTAVDGRVLIYIHKERELKDVEARYPAEHYVFVDDKARLLAAVKETWGPRVTTVFPRQGHYALAPDVIRYAVPDLSIERIGDLNQYDLAALIGAAGSRRNP